MWLRSKVRQVLPEQRPVSMAPIATTTGETRNMRDIPIGDGKTIKWVTPDVPFGDVVEVDDLLPDADWFWRGLQMHCVIECCGIMAYDVTPQAIRWAAGDDVSPPVEVASRIQDRGDAAELVHHLDETIAKLEELDADVLCSTLVFDEVFDAAVFVELLQHVADVLRHTRGYEVVTTDS